MSSTVHLPVPAVILTLPEKFVSVKAFGTARPQITQFI